MVVQVHVGWLEGGTAVFAFWGTATAQDGMQDVKIFSKNIDYLQELYPGVKAHTGKQSHFCCEHVPPVSADVSALVASRTFVCLPICKCTVASESHSLMSR